MHLYLLRIKFPINILTFYFQTIRFLLPFSKSCFNLVLVLFLHFSFYYSLKKVPSFPGFHICITMKLKNLAFWHKWLDLVQKVIFCHYLFVFIFRCMNTLALSWTTTNSSNKSFLIKALLWKGRKVSLKSDWKQTGGGEELNLSLSSLCEKLSDFSNSKYSYF